MHLVIAVVIGIQLLVNGVVRLMQSFAADHAAGGERVLPALMGIFSILVGVARRVGTHGLREPHTVRWAARRENVVPLIRS